LGIIAGVYLSWWRGLEAISNWQLATGNWQLVTGSWQLATGNQLFI
jgi:hypothetical protein